jgi:hypothetical protein
MPKHKLINKLDAHIDIFPLLSPIKKGRQLTLGDLHGNALKLLYFLIKHEIVECNEAHYQRFVEIYRKDVSSLDQQDLDEIKHICDNLIIKNKTKICLIGDVLADRGQNDYFTLLLLNKLHKESVPLDILHSNHDFTFIESFEIDGIFRSDRPCGDRIFARSMHQLQDLIDRGLVDKNEIISLVIESFLPHLKLLSCVIASHNEITRFSHARIDEEVIANLAKEMNVYFRADTVSQLASTIAAINHSFQQNYVAKNLVHTLPKKEFLVDKDDPVTFSMWNRDYTILQETTRSYKVNEVYGHDSSGPDLEGVYCLNNILGAHLELHLAEYTVLVSSLSQQPTEQILLNSAFDFAKERQKESSFVNQWFTMPQPNIQQVARMLFFGKGLDYSELNPDEENNSKNMIVVNC